MKFPIRRMVWPLAVAAGALALLAGRQYSHIDANNILRDSALLPLGAILLIIGALAALYDGVKSSFKK